MKAYYLFNGNEIIDIIINDGKVARNTYDFIRQGNESEYIKYELIELELENEFTDGINLLTTFCINNKPDRAVINSFRNVINTVAELEEDTDYRIHKYIIRFVKYENGKFTILGV